MISRFIKQELISTRKSVLLIGPRQVGKSTLINSLKPDLSINFADELEYLNFSSNPGELRKNIEQQKPKVVFIDEVQRLPRILNTVQALIDENKNLKFYLTGSSARKLKRGGANLLPGRVINLQLGPLVSAELAYKADTERALSYGCLPEIYLGTNKKENETLLRAYAANYLKEEIKAEALTRNLESFARFFQECPLIVGQFVDYTKMAKKTKISRHACPRYFEILEDTLVGNRVYPFPKAVEQELDIVKHPKFYFFDNGVLNGLLGNYVASPDRRGMLAEQLIFNQILHSSWARQKNVNIYSFRMRSGEEVDFVVEIENEIFAIEVKYSDDLQSDDYAGLNFFKELFPKANGYFIFHLGTKEKKMGNIWTFPWQKGLKQMGL
ncbi:MAG: ATP-binding protein [Bdellovibrio sp.]